MGAPVSLLEQLLTLARAQAQALGVAWDEELPIPQLQERLQLALVRERARAAVAVLAHESRACALATAANIGATLGRLARADVERYLALRGWQGGEALTWRKVVRAADGSHFETRTVHLSEVAGAPVLPVAALAVLEAVERRTNVQILADILQLAEAAARSPMLTLTERPTEPTGGAPC